MDALTVIRQARDAGLRLEPVDGGLAVTPSDRLTPELRTLLREHKPQILPILRAANDAPTLGTLLTIHGDMSAGGVDWSAWALTTADASDSWLVLTASGLTLLRTAQSIPTPRSYRQAWPLERVEPWPDDDDAPSAREMAAEAIDRARACWDCQSLRTVSTPSNRFPRCTSGHRLAWSQVGGGGVRSEPRRTDGANCGDRHD